MSKLIGINEHGKKIYGGSKEYEISHDKAFKPLYDKGLKFSITGIVDTVTGKDKIDKSIKTICMHDVVIHVEGQEEPIYINHIWIRNDLVPSIMDIYKQQQYIDKEYTFTNMYAITYANTRANSNNRYQVTNLSTKDLWKWTMNNR